MVELLGFRVGEIGLGCFLWVGFGCVGRLGFRVMFFRFIVFIEVLVKVVFILVLLIWFRVRL